MPDTTPAPVTGSYGTAFADPFVLVRSEDETGFSGTGMVADGVRFPDGTAVLHWRGPLNSTTVFESLEMLEKIHGHNGKTTVVWVDQIRVAAAVGGQL